MSELNPFWARFLHPEQHYGVSQQPLAPAIEKALNQVEEKKTQVKDKKQREMNKILALEKQLADLNKKQRQMKALA